MISSLIGLIYFMLIGLIAGWLASALMKGRGRASMLRYLVLGIIGSLLGGFLFRLVGLAAYGLIAQLIMATLGAVLLIFLMRKVI
jgi:uncharacterized membrane protein YeaQ/YmgE (transglycosylase-associated protein family)